MEEIKPKPIFVVGLPKHCTSNDSESISNMLEKDFTDYHILVYVGGSVETKFKCFYEKDFNKVKFDRLKRIISDSLKK